MKIYLITGDMKDESPWFEQIERILKSGIDMLQYRERQSSTLTMYERARKLKFLCKKYNTPLIINNRVDICLAVDADGVHLGKDDLPLEEARKILGPEKIIGASARTIDAVINGEENKVDYYGSGAVFRTNTKGDAQPMALTDLIRIAASTNLPVYAIGGINEENLDNLKNTGITGICLSEGLMNSSNPKRLIEKVRSMS